MDDEELIGEVAAALLANESPYIDHIHQLALSKRPDTRAGRIALLEAVLNDRHLAIRDKAADGLWLMRSYSSWPEIHRLAVRESNYYRHAEKFKQYAYMLREMEEINESDQGTQ